VRYRLRDLPAALTNPVDRSQLFTGQLHRAWPALRRVAALHRATLARSTQVTAVIGSVGKTTAARAVTVALGLPLGQGMGLNDKAFLPFQLLRIGPGEPFGVVEVGIDAVGQMREFAAMVRPNICLVTAVGGQHGRSFRTLERTRDEKAYMVRALSPGGCAVLNIDDPNVAWMASQTNARVLTYGRSELADFRLLASHDEFPHGVSHDVLTPQGPVTVKSPLVGPYVGYQLLGALAVAYSAGVTLETACDRLAEMSTPPGRMQIFKLDSGATLIGDYSTSTIDTVDAALDYLERLPGERKIAVLGDLTEVVAPVRPHYRRIGAKAASCSGMVAFYGSQLKSYRAGALSTGMSRDNILLANKDLQLTIEWLRTRLRDGDVVLLKARSHQRFERIALALQGRRVGCELSFCRAANIECETCAMLESGWRDRTTLL
jgi:UDP-N-acetylmuramoyl-tripeptide--D-alanyl-D-alanine ligase